MDLFILHPTEISGIYGIMESTRGLYVTWQVRVMESFLVLNLIISTNYADMLGRTYFPSCF